MINYCSQPDCGVRMFPTSLADNRLSSRNRSHRSSWSLAGRGHWPVEVARRSGSLLTERGLQTRPCRERRGDTCPRAGQAEAGPDRRRQRHGHQLAGSPLMAGSRRAPGTPAPSGTVRTPHPPTRWQRQRRCRRLDTGPLRPYADPTPAPRRACETSRPPPATSVTAFPPGG